MKNEIKRGIFNLFHDGSIISLEKRASDIECIVEIQYLAELFNPAYTFFKVILRNIQLFAFESWAERTLSTDIEKISRIVSEMEISGARCQNEQIFIDCRGDYKTIGGTLLFSCDEVIVLDQSDRRISPEQLEEKANSLFQ